MPRIGAGDLTWVAPHRLFFAPGYRVLSLDPSTMKVRFIAQFSDFLISPNGRWLAGFFNGYDTQNTAALVSLRTGRCVVVPRKPDESDSIGDWYPHTGFTRAGSVVVAGRDNAGRVARRSYRISRLRAECPRWFTKKP